MKSFIEAMNEMSEPYFICAGTVEGGPLYDYGVCGVLEDLAYKYMDEGEISASFSYCDFECDGICVKGCMTITYFEVAFVPHVITILYERDLSTCYE